MKRLCSLLFLFLTVQAIQAAQDTIAQVKKVRGEAELLRVGREERPIELKGGEKVCGRDRIYTGMDSKVELELTDKSRVVIEELTDVKIASLQIGADAVRTRLWLKAGEISTEVHRTVAIESDFEVRTPTATCSVRGSGGRTQAVGDRTRHWTRTGEWSIQNERTGQSTAIGKDQEAASVDQETESPQKLESRERKTDVSSDGISFEEKDYIEDTIGFVEHSGTVAPGDVGSAGGNPVVNTAVTDTTSPPSGYDTGFVQNGEFAEGFQAWDPVPAGCLNIHIVTVDFGAGSFGNVSPPPDSLDGGKTALMRSQSGAYHEIRQEMNLDGSSTFDVKIKYNFIRTYSPDATGTFSYSLWKAGGPTTSATLEDASTASFTRAVSLEPPFTPASGKETGWKTSTTQVSLPPGEYELDLNLNSLSSGNDLGVFIDRVEITK